MPDLIKVSPSQLIESAYPFQKQAGTTGVSLADLQPLTKGLAANLSTAEETSFLSDDLATFHYYLQVSGECFMNALYQFNTGLLTVASRFAGQDQELASLFEELATLTVAPYYPGYEHSDPGTRGGYAKPPRIPPIIPRPNEDSDDPPSNVPESTEGPIIITDPVPVPPPLPLPVPMPLPALVP
jgi:hypothetical protein